MTLLVGGGNERVVSCAVAGGMYGEMSTTDRSAHFVFFGYCVCLCVCNLGWEGKEGGRSKMLKSSEREMGRVCRGNNFEGSDLRVVLTSVKGLVAPRLQMHGGLGAVC